MPEAIAGPRDTPSSMSSAPMRTIGSGSARPFRAKSMFDGETRGNELGQRTGAGKRRRRGSAATQQAASRHADRSTPHETPAYSGTFAVGAVPALDCGGRPFASICRQWQSLQALGVPRVDGQIRARDAETVVVPPIDDHVGARRACGRRRSRSAGLFLRGGDASRPRTCPERGIAGRRRHRELGAWRHAARGNRCR